MPTFFLRLNVYGVPYRSLWVSTIVVQALLYMIRRWGLSYLDLAKISSCSTIGPYLVTAAYALKLCITGETYIYPENDGELITLIGAREGITLAKRDGNSSERYRDMFFALMALIFSIGMLCAAGWESFFLVVACYTFALVVKLLLIFCTHIHTDADQF
mmetsp:Transcript_24303/g.29665  ORF Transcript_24303/g.29665 Transcript_24303/m.29665 type:complete len:159 (-) Transcript_24303:1765-2241(-)